MKLNLQRYTLGLALFLVFMAVGALKEGPEFVAKLMGWGFLVQMMLMLHVLTDRSEK